MSSLTFCPSLYDSRLFSKLKGFPDACCGNEFAVLPADAEINGKTRNYLVASPQVSLFTHPPSPLALLKSVQLSYSHRIQISICNYSTWNHSRCSRSVRPNPNSWAWNTRPLSPGSLPVFTDGSCFLPPRRFALTHNFCSFVRTNSKVSSFRKNPWRPWGLQPQHIPGVQSMQSPVQRSQREFASASIDGEGQRPLCTGGTRGAGPASKTAAVSSRALGMCNRKKPNRETTPSRLSYPLQSSTPQRPRSVLILCYCSKIFSLSPLNNTLVF